MLSFLKDTIWQFLGTVVAVVAVGISVVFYLRSCSRKRLSYRILANTPLLTVDEQIRGRVKVMFDNQEVSNSQMVLVRVANSGNVPVTAADFVKPIKFTIRGTSRILSAEITRTVPNSLEGSIITSEKQIAINPLLLNAGDSLELKIICADYDQPIEIDARIVGVSMMEDVRRTGINRFAVSICLAYSFVIVSWLIPGLSPLWWLANFISVCSLIYAIGLLIRRSD